MSLSKPFSQRFQVGDLRHRNFKRPGESLCRTAGDAQSGKASRAFAERNQSQIRLFNTGFMNEIPHHRQQSFAVAAAYVLHMHEKRTVRKKNRSAAVFLRCIKRQNMRNQGVSHGKLGLRFNT